MVISNGSLYRFFYIAAFVFLLAYAYTAFQQMHESGGWLLASFFASLAIAFRGSKTLKGYWYSVMILAVASVAMYYPEYFKTVGDKKATFFIPYLLQVIMFGMGTE